MAQEILMRQGRMYNPPHPGEVLYEMQMQPVGITISALAQKIGVDRKTVSRVVHGHASISTEMALLLSRAFNTSPQLWLNMQHAYDLWHKERALGHKIREIEPFETAQFQ